MRLQPIEHPRSLIMRIAYWMTKRKFGHVISSVKYVYSKKFPLLLFGKRINDIERKFLLPENHRLMIRNLVSKLNYCEYCNDLGQYLAAKANVQERKIIELMEFRHSDTFTAKEKAMLTYAEEVTLTKQATDETFNALRVWFNEEEIIEITWVCATETYYNMMAHPLGVPSDHMKAAKPVLA